MRRGRRRRALLSGYGCPAESRSSVVKATATRHRPNSSNADCFDIQVPVCMGFDPSRFARLDIHLQIPQNHDPCNYFRRDLRDRRNVRVGHRLGMDAHDQNRFSGPVTIFQERRLPAVAAPAGYAALIGAYGLRVPLPRILSATGERHKFIEKNGWRIHSPRHAPKSSLEGHLAFALKHEGLDLAVLKHLFAVTGPVPVETRVGAKPTDAYARCIRFLYEWLTGRRLDLPSADRGAYVPVVDPDRQFSASPEISRRHRVRNNLPGPFFRRGIAGARAGHRRCSPQRSAGANGGFSFAERFQIQLCHRRRTFSPEPHSAVEPGHQPSRPEAD